MEGEKEMTGIINNLGESDVSIVACGKHGENDNVGVSLSYKGGPTELTILITDLLRSEELEPLVMEAVNRWANHCGFTFTKVDHEPEEVGNVVKIDFTPN